MRDGALISQCPRESVGILLSQIRKFHAEESRLQWIKTTVEAFEYVVVTRLCAIISQSSHSFGQTGVMSNNRTSVAQSSDILGGIETDSRGIAKRTGKRRSVKALSQSAGAESLRAVFNYFQPMFFGTVCKSRIPGHTPVEMHCHYSTSAWRDGSLKERCVKIHGLLIYIYRNRNKPGIADGKH